MTFLKKNFIILIFANFLLLGALLSVHHILLSPPIFGKYEIFGIISGLIALMLLPMAIFSKSKTASILLFTGYVVVMGYLIVFSLIALIQYFVFYEVMDIQKNMPPFILIAIFLIIMHFAFFAMIRNGGKAERVLLFLFLFFVDALFSRLYIFLNNFERAFNNHSGINPKFAIILYPGIFFGFLFGGALISYFIQSIYLRYKVKSSKVDIPQEKTQITDGNEQIASEQCRHSEQ